jgi:hypothetical protein
MPRKGQSYYAGVPLRFADMRQRVTLAKAVSISITNVVTKFD